MPDEKLSPEDIAAVQKKYAKMRSDGSLQRNPEAQAVIQSLIKDGVIRDLSGGSVYPEQLLTRRPAPAPAPTGGVLGFGGEPGDEDSWIRNPAPVRPAPARTKPLPGVMFRKPVVTSDAIPHPVATAPRTSQYSVPGMGSSRLSEAELMAKADKDAAEAARVRRVLAAPPVEGKTGAGDVRAAERDDAEAASLESLRSMKGISPESIRASDPNLPRFGDTKNHNPEALTGLLIPLAGSRAAVKIIGSRYAKDPKSTIEALKEYNDFLGQDDAGAFHRGFQQGVAPGAAGFGLYSTGSSLAGELPIPNPILRGAASVVGGLAASMLGGGAVAAANDAVTKAAVGNEAWDEVLKQRQKDYTENPLASQLGSSATAILFGKATSEDLRALPTVLKLARQVGIRKALESPAGLILSDVTRERLMESGIEVVAGGAESLVYGRPMGWRSTGIDAATGALWPGENSLGKVPVHGGHALAGAILNPRGAASNVRQSLSLNPNYSNLGFGESGIDLQSPSKVAGTAPLNPALAQSLGVSIPNRAVNPTERTQALAAINQGSAPASPLPGVHPALAGLTQQPTARPSVSTAPLSVSTAPLSVAPTTQTGQGMFSNLGESDPFASTGLSPETADALREEFSLSTDAELMDLYKSVKGLSISDPQSGMTLQSRDLLLDELGSRGLVLRSGSASSSMPSQTTASTASTTASEPQTTAPSTEQESNWYDQLDWSKASTKHLLLELELTGNDPQWAESTQEIKQVLADRGVAIPDTTANTTADTTAGSTANATETTSQADQFYPAYESWVDAGGDPSTFRESVVLEPAVQSLIEKRYAEKSSQAAQTTQAPGSTQTTQTGATTAPGTAQTGATTTKSGTSSLMDLINAADENSQRQIKRIMNPNRRKYAFNPVTHLLEDAELFKHLAIVGAAKIARGIHAQVQWNAAMISDHGDFVSSKLDDIWKDSLRVFRAWSASKAAVSNMTVKGQKVGTLPGWGGEGATPPFSNNLDTKSKKAETADKSMLTNTDKDSDEIPRVTDKWVEEVGNHYGIQSLDQMTPDNRKKMEEFVAQFPSLMPPVAAATPATDIERELANSATRSQNTLKTKSGAKMKPPSKEVAAARKRKPTALQFLRDFRKVILADGGFTIFGYDGQGYAIDPVTGTQGQGGMGYVTADANGNLVAGANRVGGAGSMEGRVGTGQSYFNIVALMAPESILGNPSNGTRYLAYLYNQALHGEFPVSALETAVHAANKASYDNDFALQVTTLALAKIPAKINSDNRDRAEALKAIHALIPDHAGFVQEIRTLKVANGYGKDDVVEVAIEDGSEDGSEESTTGETPEAGKPAEKRKQNPAAVTAGTLRIVNERLLRMSKADIKALQDLTGKHGDILFVNPYISLEETGKTLPKGTFVERAKLWMPTLQKALEKEGYRPLPLALFVKSQNAFPEEVYGKKPGVAVGGSISDKNNPASLPAMVLGIPTHTSYELAMPGAASGVLDYGKGMPLSPFFDKFVVGHGLDANGKPILVNAKGKETRLEWNVAWKQGPWYADPKHKAEILDIIDRAIKEQQNSDRQAKAKANAGLSTQGIGSGTSSNNAGTGQTGSAEQEGQSGKVDREGVGGSPSDGNNVRSVSTAVHRNGLHSGGQVGASDLELRSGQKGTATSKAGASNLQNGASVLPAGNGSATGSNRVADPATDATEEQIQALEKLAKTEVKEGSKIVATRLEDNTLTEEQKKQILDSISPEWQEGVAAEQETRHIAAITTELENPALTEAEKAAILAPLTTAQKNRVAKLQVSRANALEKLAAKLKEKEIKAAEKLKARNAKAKTQKNAAFTDPLGLSDLGADLVDYSIIGASKLANLIASSARSISSSMSTVGKGVKAKQIIVSFSKWSDSMIKDYGTGITPHLADLWRESHRIIDALRPKSKQQSFDIDAVNAIISKDLDIQQHVYPELVDKLEAIAKAVGGAEIVLSTSHSSRPLIAHARALRKQGLRSAAVSGMTVSYPTVPWNRHPEIMQWVEEEGISNYLVLSSSPGAGREFGDARHVVTNPKVGISDEDVQKAIKILAGQLGQRRIIFLDYDGVLNDGARNTSTEAYQTTKELTAAAIAAAKTETPDWIKNPVINTTPLSGEEVAYHMPTKEQVESNLKYKLGRKKDDGKPKNSKMVLRNKDGGGIHIIGEQTYEEWESKILEHMSREEILAAAEYYRIFRPLMEKYFGDDLATPLSTAWLAGNVQTKPAQVLRGVMQGIDWLEGRPPAQGKVHSFPKVSDSMMSFMRGTLSGTGIAQKLSDFTDSSMGKKTRSAYGNDPRAGQPFTVDVWEGRNAGFVDPPVLAHLENFIGGTVEVDGDTHTIKSVDVAYKFKKSKPKEIDGKMVPQPDEKIAVSAIMTTEGGKKIPVAMDYEGAPSRANYEWGSEFGNHITDNAKGLMGQAANGEAAAIQAINWSAMSKSFSGKSSDSIEVMFDKNRAHIAAELEFDPESDLGIKYQSIRNQTREVADNITRDVLETVVGEIKSHLGRSAATLQVSQSVGGTAFEEGARPSWQITGIVSPETAQLISSHIGAALGQRENYILRFLTEDEVRTNTATKTRYVSFSIPGVDLSDPSIAEVVYNKIKEAEPRFGQGFSVLTEPDGSTQMVIANDKNYGSWGGDTATWVTDSRKNAAAAVSAELEKEVLHDDDYVHFNATRNDWKADPTGEGHYDWLNTPWKNSKGEKRPFTWGEVEKSWQRDHLRGVARQAIEDAYTKHYPGYKEGLADAGGDGGAGSITAQPGSARTQRGWVTKQTYARLSGDISDVVKPGDRVIDYGAGDGDGTDAMREKLRHAIVQAYEIQAEKWKGKTPVDFTDPSKIPAGWYDYLVSLNVLNVLEPELRRHVTKHILSLIAPGGKAFIGARGWTGDVAATTNFDTYDGEGNSLWVLTTETEKTVVNGKTVVNKKQIRTFHHGFSSQELADYVQSVAKEMGLDGQFEFTPNSNYTKAGVFLRRKVAGASGGSKTTATSVALGAGKPAPKLPVRDRSGVGKTIGGATYVHKDYINSLPEAARVAAAKVRDFDYTIVKYNPSTGATSFLKSPDWNTADEPQVGESRLVSKDGQVTTTKALQDPWIYHHKWLFVKDDYSGFDVAKSKARSAQWMPLINPGESARIGKKSYWETQVVPRLSAAGDVAGDGRDTLPEEYLAILRDATPEWIQAKLKQQNLPDRFRFAMEQELERKKSLPPPVKSPIEASATGKPVSAVLYHGGTVDNEFAPEYKGRGRTSDDEFKTGAEAGHWFSDSLDVASSYAEVMDGKTQQFAISLKNPLVVSPKSEYVPTGKSFDRLLATAKKNSHDGVIFKNVYDGLGNSEIGTSVLVFDEGNISRATEQASPGGAPTSPTKVEAAQKRVDAAKAALDAEVSRSLGSANTAFAPPPGMIAKAGKWLAELAGLRILQGAEMFSSRLEVTKLLVAQMGEEIRPFIDQVVAESKKHFASAVAPRYSTLGKKVPAYLADWSDEVQVIDEGGVLQNPGGTPLNPPTNPAAIKGLSIKAQSTLAEEMGYADPTERSGLSRGFDQTIGSALSNYDLNLANAWHKINDGRGGALTEEQRIVAFTEQQRVRVELNELLDKKAKGSRLTEEEKSNLVVLASQATSLGAAIVQSGSEAGRALALSNMLMDDTPGSLMRSVDKAVMISEGRMSERARFEMLSLARKGEQEYARVDSDLKREADAVLEEAKAQARQIIQKANQEALSVTQAATARSGESEAASKGFGDKLIKEAQERADKIVADAQAKADKISASQQSPGNDIYSEAKARGSRTASKSYGKNNTIVDRVAYEKARAALRTSLFRTHSGVPGVMPLDMAQALLQIGTFHFEAGLRQFVEWAKEVRLDVGTDVPEAHMQSLWLDVKAEVSANKEKRTPPPPPSIFVEIASQRLGRENAQKFLEDILNDDGEPVLLQKLIDNEQLTVDEKKIISDAWRKNSPDKTRRANPASASLAEALKEFRVKSTYKSVPLTADQIAARSKARVDNLANTGKATKTTPRLKPTDPLVIQATAEYADVRSLEAFTRAMETRLGIGTADEKLPEQLVRDLFSAAAREYSKKSKGIKEIKMDLSKAIAAEVFSRESWLRKRVIQFQQNIQKVIAFSATLDISFFGRQGGKIVAARPDIGLRAFKEGIKAFRDPDIIAGIDGEIQGLEKLKGKTGGYSTLPDFTVPGGEENMEAILMDGPLWSALKRMGIEKSEEVNRSMLNRLRLDYFKALTSPDDPPEMHQAMANLVNVFSSRGVTKFDMGAVQVELNGAIQVASNALGFWSPRNNMANVQFLGGTAILKPLISAGTSITPKARNANLKATAIATREYARYVTTIGLTLGIVNAIAKAFKWDDWLKAELNPLSKDFGKIKVRNQEFDLTSGWRKHWSFIVDMFSLTMQSKFDLAETLKDNLPEYNKMLAAGQISAEEYKKMLQPQRLGVKEPGKTAISYLRTMSNPLVGEAITQYMGSDFKGSPVKVYGFKRENAEAPLKPFFDPKVAAMRWGLRLGPISITQWADALMETGFHMPREQALSMAAGMPFEGIGVGNTYRNRSLDLKAKEDQKKKDEKLFFVPVAPSGIRKYFDD